VQKNSAVKNNIRKTLKEKKEMIGLKVAKRKKTVIELKSITSKKKTVMIGLKVAKRKKTVIGLNPDPDPDVSKSRIRIR
jgi:hypothetical protein